MNIRGRHHVVDSSEFRKDKPYWSTKKFGHGNGLVGTHTQI